MGTAALTQLAARYHSTSEEQQATATGLLSNALITEKDKLLITAMVGLLSARLFGSLAEVATAIASASGPLSPIESRRELFQTWTAKLRTAQAKAVATGDWSDYDKMINDGWNPNATGESNV